MAGADHSGEEMQSGRTNRAEDRTVVWAQEPRDRAFDGDAIFIAEGAGDIEDDDFTQPSGSIHGILGRAVGEGAGVVGLDATADRDVSTVTNLGVLGRGNPGVRGEGGRAGPGVEGLGGDDPFRSIQGAGVIGRGGRQLDEGNNERKAHGPGVVGMGGGRGQQLQNATIVDNVGVFGQGATAEPRVDGPQAAGAGVVGRGGVTIAGEDPPAPGVVGWAGGSDVLPVMAFKGDIGVIGFGGTGVKGLALEGPGVHGVGSDGPGGAATNRGVMGPGVLGHGGRSTGLTGVRLIHAAGVIGVAGDTTPQSSETNETGVYGTGHDGVRGAGTDGRGGIFQSARTAQVQLVPTVKSVGRERSAFTPVTVSNAETAGPELPRNGRAGDLMCVLDQDGQCSLWFCVRSPSSGVTAQWAQVLLGPQFNGRG